MKNRTNQNSILSLLFLFLFLNAFNLVSQTPLETNKSSYAIVIHGGAGYMKKGNLPSEAEKNYLNALHEALDIGEQILSKGGSSLDAVEQTIRYMEDNPIFNAGKGAVFTNSGKNELDASIMYGKDQNAGAVGGVETIKNPITAARAVMEKSQHVMLTGKGASLFAKKEGLEIVAPQYFYTKSKWNSLQNVLKSEKKKTPSPSSKKEKHGTVGCVALDINGNITAGTSTGGMTNKKFNRIGDSPIIGAGTFADNESCGVSCTGHGEFFIRYTIARDVAAMMEYGGKTLNEAGEYLINQKLVKKGGAGGLIAIDKSGHIIMPFNTTSMLRGYCNSKERVVKIFK